ncbi:E3 ubiquitin-protein ligase march2 [Desmophyllum pertusum]|uniref:E3 ubiquitin-protein ligase march2 n=1 Tax=Desmophyllum pertusum TaxID=174260 RepID=A0A9W9YC68_9CNID|nr:E3 ubiquitin-protein ligase march2 [Desmophyllum pertusum]
MMELKDNQSEDFQNDGREHSLFSTECLSSNGITFENSTQSCRICQTSGNSEPEVGELLASPCNCRGSLGFVHKQCMEKWLRVRNRDTCELCHFKFVTKRRFKPPHEWHFGQVVDMLSSNEKGLLVLGFVNFLLLILEIPFLYYVIKINSRYFVSEIYDTEPSQETYSEIYTLLLTLLLIFSLVLVASSAMFTVIGFKVFRKILRFSREVVLIIPMRHLEETLEEEDVV